MTNNNNGNNFVWQSGEAVNYTNWNAGEPNGTSQNVAARLVKSNGNWTDRPLENHFEYVVEVPVPTMAPTCSPTGSITREVWTNISGVSVSQIPVNTTPNLTEDIALFETPTNFAENYGTRVSGFIHPTVSGDYRFWIATDDNGELWLSTDNNPANRTRIAYVPGYTTSRQWNKFPEQRSALIHLEAGQHYYIEALQKEAGGGDNLAVRWALPDGTIQEPIPGSVLSGMGDCVVEDELTVTQIAGPTSGSNFPVGETPIIFQVTDACGNLEVCEFNVTIEENLADFDLIDCPSDITINTLPGAITAVATFTEPGGTSTCFRGGPVSVVQNLGLESGEAFPIGITQITYAVFDSCGNFEGCNFNVNVVEVAAAISATCPEDVILQTMSNNNTVTATWTEPTATTDCFAGGLTSEQVSGPANGSDLAVGVYPVIYVFTDACNNTELCTFNVVVNSCTDMDGDGICAADDCDDNDASLPATPGTACNDGNADTENDVIGADGCSCAGIIIPCILDQIVTVSSSEEICAPTGAITFSFGDTDGRTQIAFSLDGGATYEPNVQDNIGSITYDGLTAGTYDLMVRWGDTDCPTELGSVVIAGNGASPEADFTSTPISCGATDGSITFSFDNAPNRTHLEFSLDGGNNWLGNVSDVTSSITYNGLAAGTYELYIRWGDDACPNPLGQVTLLSPNQSTPGTACNDGDASTENDVIGADGCSCAGTPVVNCTVAGGQIAFLDGSTEQTICADDGIADPLDVNLFGSIGSNQQWIITDSEQNILGLPAAPPFDLEGVFPGTCLIYSLSYEAGISGLSAENNLDDLDGCFELSNNVAIIRLVGSDCPGFVIDEDGDGIPASEDCDDNDASVPTTPGTACDDGNVDTENDVIGADGCSCAGTPIVTCTVAGGQIEFLDASTEQTICADDGIADPLDVNLFGSIGSNQQWIITDSEQNILGLPAAPPFDLEGVFPGTCLIYSLSYEAGISGLSAENNLDDLDGCFELSNNVAIIRLVGSDCPGFVIDEDGDGIPAGQDCDDNNANLPAMVGTACNDGDASTENDVIGADGCSCAGTPIETGCNPGFILSPGNITITGLNGAVNTVKLLDISNGYNDIVNCFGGCPTPASFDLPAGPYFLQVTVRDANYNVICELNENVTISDGCMTGASCDDGDVCTDGDVFDEDCNCVGTPVADNDNDGICAVEDCDDNNASVPATPGSACDDGNADTENDVVGADGCSCAGTPIATCTVAGGQIAFLNGSTTQTICADDGIADPLDVSLSGTIGSSQQWIITDSEQNILGLPAAPPFNLEGAGGGTCLIYSLSFEDEITGVMAGANLADFAGCLDLSNSISVVRLIGSDCPNQVVDNDNDGIPADQDCDDNNANLPAMVGTACNDGDASTENDVIGADGCSCAGTPIETGCNPGFILSPGNITVTGLNGAVNSVKLLDISNGYVDVVNCFGNCPTPASFDLPAGPYLLQVSVRDANYNVICLLDQNVVIPDGCTTGAVCNDGDDCTTGDVFDENCNCVGTPVADNDNDGFCAVEDCDDNNASLPAAPGTACDDGNAETTGDVIGADGCSCAGVIAGACNPTATAADSSLIISGLSGPANVIQIFNTANWSTVINCFGDCQNQVVAVDPGNYFVRLRVLDASYQEVCVLETNVVVGGSTFSIAADTEFLHLFAREENRAVGLNWVNNSEYRNDYFVIERSVDGIDFTELKTVDAYGYENQNVTNYEDRDVQPALGEGFYRIRQVFEDGSIRYSNVEKVSFDIDLTAIGLFPNPAETEVQLSLVDFAGRSAEIQIYSPLGVLMDGVSLDEIPETAIRFNVADYQAGLYTITVKVDQRKRFSKRFVKMKR